MSKHKPKCRCGLKRFPIRIELDPYHNLPDLSPWPSWSMFDEYGRFMANFGCHDGTEKNAKRVFACYMACESMDDPATEIAALREQLAEMTKNYTDLRDHYTEGSLRGQIAQLREAVKLLAEDRVNGVPDMIGAAVVANKIAMDAVNAALAKPRGAAVTEKPHGPG